MLKLLLLVLVLVMAYIFLQTYPDIRRYMKIRSM